MGPRKSSREKGRDIGMKIVFDHKRKRETFWSERKWEKVSKCEKDGETNRERDRIAREVHIYIKRERGKERKREGKRGREKERCIIKDTRERLTKKLETRS